MSDWIRSVYILVFPGPSKSEEIYPVGALINGALRYTSIYIQPCYYHQ